MPRVSLCIIARNEERRLPVCLASAADLVDDVVVVDTGSTDQTCAVAQRFGARVAHFSWCDDFAAARNETLRHAHGDWIFWLDADDRLDDVNRARLRTLFGELPEENVAFVMRCQSESGSSGPATALDQTRLFRRLPGLRWRYRIHEQILPAVLEQGGKVVRTDIAIWHSGYTDGGEKHRKLERNLRLLLLEQADHPRDALVLFHLGWTYSLLGQPAGALPILQQCLQFASPGDIIVRKVYALLVRSLRQLGQKEHALNACVAGKRFYVGDPELLFHEGQLLRELGDLEGAAARLRQLVETPEESYVAISVDPALKGCKGHCALADVYHALGRFADAEKHWRLALEQQPDFAVASLSLTDLWLAQGRWFEVERLVESLASNPATGMDAALVRARVFMMQQDWPAARQLLETTCARHPRSLWPRELLARVLLQEGDGMALERTLREILVQDPTHSVARQQLPLARGLQERGGPTIVRGW